MKQPRKSVRRELFVLTPDEKRAAACVIGAFVLGLATMHYRAKHPRSAAAPTATEERDAKNSVLRSRTPRKSTVRPVAAAGANDGTAEGAADDE